MSVGLLADCKVGTEGGGTAIPRLDLHSREGEKNICSCSTISDSEFTVEKTPELRQQLQLHPTGLAASTSLWSLDYRLFSERPEEHRSTHTGASLVLWMLSVVPALGLVCGSLAWTTTDMWI